MSRAPLSVLTIGWDPAFARALLDPVASRTGISFTHSVVGDARRVELLQREHRDHRWIAIGPRRGVALPDADVALLASLEGPGVPTVRSMVRGDPVVRHRPGEDALRYATLLARRIGAAIDEAVPDVVLANFDNVHAAISLGVARQRDVPWVALAFSVIPEHLTAFARGMTPEDLVPITRPVDPNLRREAEEVMARYRAAAVRIMAYRPPESLGARVRQFVTFGRNFARRAAHREQLGVEPFTFPSATERVTDIARRAMNRLRFPAERMLRETPKERFVFFPLHMAPESSVDTWAPMYQNQIELAVQVALAAPVDVDVVVKLHFSDPDNYAPGDLRRLMSLPRVFVAHPGTPSRAFIERASLVVGIQGTASLEAALWGKPVLLFGNSPYQHFPRSERAVRADLLGAQIQRMLKRRPATDDEIVSAFAAYMSRYMPGRINDWNIPMSEPDYERLAGCFRRLSEYLALPRVRETWYEAPPFAAGPLSTPGQVALA